MLGHNARGISGDDGEQVTSNLGGPPFLKEDTVKRGDADWRRVTLTVKSVSHKVIREFTRAYRVYVRNSTRSLGIMLAIMSMLLNWLLSVYTYHLHKKSYLQCRDSNDISQRGNDPIHIHVAVHFLQGILEQRSIYFRTRTILWTNRLTTLKEATFGRSGRNEGTTQGTDDMSNVVRVRVLDRISFNKHI